MDREEEKLKVLIITGLSGGGKTQAANCLEDLGYFCVDNLPPALIPKFTELSNQAEGRVKKVAFVVDVRGGRFFDNLSLALEELNKQGLTYEILFLEAKDEVILRRFKESRRKHPLSTNGAVPEAIQQEKKMLEELRGQANTIIDTSNLNVHQLKDELLRLYGQQDDQGLITVTTVSFGYKFGLPMDADLIMDVRFLPNPNYVPELSHLTGEDKGVVGYVMGFPVTRNFLRKFVSFLKFLVPEYVKEGKTHLVLAIGCTGGQHRSVALTNYVGKQLQKLGYHTIIKHRDLEKYRGKDA
ncbi:MAG: RNase adapter RapZ [Acidobacteriota bacterium]